MLTGNFLFTVILIFKLSKSVEERLIFTGFFVGVDNEGSGDGFKDMVILLIDHIVMAIVMFQRSHQSRLGANHNVVLEVVQQHIFIFVVAHNLVNLLIKRGREI